jgi:predicted phosphoribosyltransferase
VLDELKGAAEEVVVLAKPFPFYAVGAAYQQFDQLSDEEVSSYFQSPLVGAGRG